jgi:hypothetical protein
MEVEGRGRPPPPPPWEWEEEGWVVKWGEGGGWGGGCMLEFGGKNVPLRSRLKKTGNMWSLGSMPLQGKGSVSSSRAPRASLAFRVCAAPAVVDDEISVCVPERVRELEKQLDKDAHA